WGSYWQWDPVQTWSLLAWLVYANALHGRYMWKWRGGLTAIHSIIGFGLSIVSFLIGAGLINISGHFPITGNS
ncbi:MAG: cytochrome c biogenesis protein CcsA, partial [Proteobacteria bacterium]|nr:cytochrome c biogenesis protein CcsA [Pseudomonadota bacterium]